MRRSTILIAMAALCATYVSAQATRKSEDESKLRSIERETTMLEEGEGLDKLSLLADDWVRVQPGAVVTKKELAKALKVRGGPAPYSIKKEKMRIYVFGDTAVVTYLQEYHSPKGELDGLQEDYTDVFTRSPNSWRLCFTKYTPLQGIRLSY